MVKFFHVVSLGQLRAAILATHNWPKETSVGHQKLADGPQPSTRRRRGRRHEEDRHHQHHHQGPEKGRGWPEGRPNQEGAHRGAFEAGYDRLRAQLGVEGQHGWKGQGEAHQVASSSHRLEKGGNNDLTHPGDASGYQRCAIPGAPHTTRESTS